MRLVLLLALALVAAGCSLLSDDGEGRGEGNVTAPAEGTIPSVSTVLRVATAEWPECLNPLTCADDAARTLVLQHVVPQLMELDAAGRHVPSPVLAGTPEVRVDPDTGEQTIVFVLAQAARWHDGKPITSSDVKGTWLARQATPGASTPGHELITAIDDSDPLVARVTLRQPWADWPELFGGHTGWLLRADAFDGDMDLTGRFDDIVPFGAGPYELVSFEERSLVLVAREDHWDPDRQAQVGQVRIDLFPALAPTPDAEAPEPSVPGSVDLVIPGAELPAVPDRFDLGRTLDSEVIGLLFDRRTEPLASTGVRAAVDEAVDRRELVELAGADPDDLVTCLASLPGTDACGEDLVEEGASVQGADFFLDLDGWPVGPGGTRARADLPLATPVSYDPSIEGAGEIAEAVAGQLAARGFVAIPQPVDAGTWSRQDRPEGTGIGVHAAPLGTATRLSALYGCNEGSTNPLAWCDPSVQALLGELAAAPDAAAVKAATAELSALAATELAWLPLHQRATPWFVDPSRVTVPDERPLGSGALGALHRFERADG